MPASIARVATDRPARYLKQLASHFSKRVDGEIDTDHARVEFDSARCCWTPPRALC